MCLVIFTPATRDGGHGLACAGSRVEEAKGSGHYRKRNAVTLSGAKGPGMDPHDHRDASLALSVTCALFLRSEAKNLGIRRGAMLR